MERTSFNANSQQLNKVFSMVDFTIINEGTIEELNQKIDEIIKKFLKNGGQDKKIISGGENS